MMRCKCGANAVQELTVKLQKKTISYIKSHGFITGAIYQEINQLVKVYSVKELNDMVSKSLINKVGRGKSTRYTLNE